MSSRTVMRRTALPGLTSTTSMPSHWLKASFSSIPATIFSASVIFERALRIIRPEFHREIDIFRRRDTARNEVTSLVNDLHHDASKNRLAEFPVLVRLRHDCIFPVIVKALPRLASEPAGFDQPPLRFGRFVERDRFGDFQVHIVADEIHELKRPEPKPAKLAHRLINGRDVRHAFLEDAQRFTAERPGHAVDDEAGRVLREHRRLAPRFHEGARPLYALLRSFLARYDFDQAHLSWRIKEMSADHPLAEIGRA